MHVATAPANPALRRRVSPIHAEEGRHGGVQLSLALEEEIEVADAAGQLSLRAENNALWLLLENMLMGATCGFGTFRR